jgi:hypothetical protein
LASEVIGALQAWERRYPVEEWKMGGIGVWPLLRNELATAMLRIGEDWKPARRGGGRTLAREARSLGKALLARWRHRTSPASVARADAVFVSHPGNRAQVGGLAVDKFFDPIADLLAEQGLRSAQLEHTPFGTAYGGPCYRPARLMGAALLRCRARARLRRAPLPERLEAGGELARELASRWPAAAPVLAQLSRRVRLIHAIAEYFGAQLECLRPRGVFVTCYYNPVGMALCLAAARRGVVSVDVQHGIVRNNPAYEGWTRFPEGGYELMPRRFWCWSAYDAGAVQGWPREAQAAHAALVAGHPWFAFWDRPPPFAADTVRAIDAMRGPGPNVLVSLSASSGFSARIQDLLRRSPRDFTWWLRLHPTMGAERQRAEQWCARHAGARVLVEPACELPLPLLLRNADVHLTQYSSVIQEASAVGTPSVVIDRRALGLFARYFDSGCARFVDEGEDVFAALRGPPRAARAAGAYPPRGEMAAAVGALLASAAAHA